MEIVNIFIDAEYVIQSLRSLQNKPKGVYLSKDDFNWSKFLDFIAKDRAINKANYYTARMDENENIEKYNNQTQYLEKINNNLSSYNIQLRLGKMTKIKIKQQSTWNKDKKKNSKDSEIFSWVQKGIDTKMVLDLCEFAYTADKEKNNIAIIITGDADFAETLQHIESLHISTELIVFKRYSYISEDLLNSASFYTILDYSQLQQQNIV